VFGSNRKDYRTVTAYDSAQQKLPADKRDNFIERRFTRQKIHLDEKYDHNGKAIWSAILEKFKHLFPQMLFVSLPLFALALQLLYFRKKSFFYVNHVVFTIHLYCGTFILILVGMGISYLAAWLDMKEAG
jgi:small-conductance mechanosensitive channel